MGEFGSSATLVEWLDSVIVPLAALPIDIDSWSDWYRVSDPESSSSIISSDISVVDTRTPTPCFCCMRCAHAVGCAAPTDVESTNDLVMLWSKIAYSQPTPDATSPACIQKDVSSVSTASPPSTPAPENDSMGLNLDPPRKQIIASTNCAECGSSLLSAKSFITPPGYCEYSGKVICGQCFEPRRIVVPWKLVRVLKPVKGNVAKSAALEIQKYFYNSSVSVHDITDRAESDVSMLIIRIVDLRRKRTSFMERNIRCSEIQSQIVDATSALPAHIRYNDSDPGLFSLGDLVDILSPTSGNSVIVHALSHIVTVVESHECKDCELNYSRICPVCDHKINSFAQEFCACNHCDSGFHAQCFEWVSMDGCPICASRKAVSVFQGSNSQFTINVELLD
jgi:hypothetical protein